jgi:hypothetical protein
VRRHHPTLVLGIWRVAGQHHSCRIQRRPERSSQLSQSVSRSVITYQNMRAVTHHSPPSTRSTFILETPPGVVQSTSCDAQSLQNHNSTTFAP